LALRYKAIRGGMHVCFRMRGCLRYFVWLRDGMVGLSKTEPCGTHEDLQMGHAEPAPDEWHALRVVARGERIDVLVDDVLIISFADRDPLLAGGFALETLEDAEFFIDDISFHPLDD